MIDTAMVLAAGLGTRFRKVSGDLPKPLMPVAGKPLMDWSLDMLATGGITRAIVNVHYKADLVEAHVRARQIPAIIISDERDELMETGGGLMRASPLLGGGPVFCSNTDAILGTNSTCPVTALRDYWRDEAMDALLYLVPVKETTGYYGAGDFIIGTDGKLSWAKGQSGLVFTGLQIIHPRLWQGEPPKAQSTKVFWDKAMASGRLYGVVHDDIWMHVGDPEGFSKAEKILQANL